MKRKLLLVDDDRVLIRTLGDFFEENGLKVIYAEDGKSAIKTFFREVPDMVILDIDLPIKNGFEVIEEIRLEDFITPIILMTGSVLSDEGKIRGYELGAIQYLEKPVSPWVLLAQIKAKLNPPVKMKVLQIGQKKFVLQNQILSESEVSITLREREALILSALFEVPNQLVNRSKISTLIWGYENSKNNKVIDNLVYNLKHSLADFPELTIRSTYSKGYTLRVE